jgi:tetratricopeptide (TPR) repeat protein
MKRQLLAIVLIIMIGMINHPLFADDEPAKKPAKHVTLMDKMKPWRQKVRELIAKKKGFVYKLLNPDKEALKDTDDTQLLQGAISRFRVRKWDEVISIATRIIKEFPDSPHVERAHFIRALSMDHHLRQTLPVDFEAIVLSYRDAIEANPGSYYIPHIQLEIGNIYFQLGKYYDALLYYKLADRSKINIRPDVLLSYGISFGLINKTEQSIQILDRLIQNHPASLQAVKARVEMAKALFQQKAFSASMKVLTKIREKDPDIIYEYPDILLYVGYNYYEMGQFRKARDILSRVINYFPDMESNHLVLTRIADLYWEDGMIDKAVHIYNQVYTNYPDTDGALISAIRLVEHAKVTAKERYAKRIIHKVKFNRLPAEVYDDIIQNHKKNPLAQLALLKVAIQKEKEGHYQESINKIIRLLKTYPSTKLKPDAQVALRTSIQLLTHRYHEQKQYNKIVNDFNQYLRYLSVKDFSGKYMLELGNSFLALELYRRAQRIYVRASERFITKEQPADLFFGMGESAFHLKEITDAVTHFTQFIKKFPEDPRLNIAYSRLGNIAYNQNQFTNAIVHFEKAIQQNVKYPDRLKDYLNLGRAYRKTQRFDRAIQSLKNNIDLFSQYKDVPLEQIFDVYHEMGEVYFQTGNKKAAAVAFENALRSVPKNQSSIPIQFRLAECYSHLQVRDKAEKILTRIKNAEDQFWSKMAEAMMKEIEVNRQIENFTQIKQQAS